MKRVIVPCFCILAALGCSSGAITGQETADAMAKQGKMFVFHSDGNGPLFLDGQDGSAGFANPRHLTLMQAFVQATGGVQMHCQNTSGPAPCSDVPLYWSLKTDANGDRCATIWDDNGAKIGTTCFQS